MDWKELLAQKVNDGVLEREDFTPDDDNPNDSMIDGGLLHVSVDRKGRKGKTVTIVDGFTCIDERLQGIAAAIKSRLGTGGSARGGEILIQGDAGDKVRKILLDMGYKVR